MKTKDDKKNNKKVDISLGRLHLYSNTKPNIQLHKGFNLGKGEVEYLSKNIKRLSKPFSPIVDTIGGLLNIVSDEIDIKKSNTPEKTRWEKERDIKQSLGNMKKEDYVNPYFKYGGMRANNKSLTKRTGRYSSNEPIFGDIQNKKVVDVLKHFFINKGGFTGFGGGNFGGAGAGYEGDLKDTYNAKWIDMRTPIAGDSFNDVFRRSRKAGLKTFEFNGKKYNTETDDLKYDPSKGRSRANMRLRMVFDENNNIQDDSTRIEPELHQPIIQTIDVKRPSKFGMGGKLTTDGKSNLLIDSGAIFKAPTYDELVAKHGNMSDDPKIRIALREALARERKVVEPVGRPSVATWVKPRKLAIGGEIGSKWTGSEYAQAGVSTAQGALSGAATGAMLGSIVPGVGTAIGAVVGGGIGLVKGILAGKSSAKNRANAQNAERLATLGQIEDKKSTDTMNMADMTNNATNFYAKLGGKYPKREIARKGLIPTSRNTEAVVGPTHEQGGVKLDNYTEVEGGGKGRRGEVILNGELISKVYSDTLGIGDKTFADVANELSIEKGRVENQFKDNEDMLEQNIRIAKRPMSVPTRGTHLRNTQKTAMRSQRMLEYINAKDNELNDVFELQESLKDNYIKPEVNKMWDGGQWQMATNIGSTMLEGIGNMITLNQMSKLPTPKRNRLEAARLNANYNISDQLDQIDSNAGAAMKYTRDNISNSNVGVQHMKDILLAKTRGRNSMYSQKYNIENNIKNENVQNNYRNNLANNEIDYDNQMTQFNRSMDQYSKQSQVISQATQGIQNAATQAAQYGYQTDELRMYASLNPNGVNKDLMGKQLWERLYGKDSWTGKKYGGRIRHTKGRLQAA